ncbi:MAG: F0F1 ATP synthase subunit epsilon [Polyangiaceae bacterium]|nr:F0F1 ATP synthase subunit epsilon [Polyangiaceae bacterium]
MADEISLEIVTPEGPQISVMVSEFTAPSVDGEFGVLAGHRPLLAATRAGIVSYRQGGEDVQVAVGEGYVDYNADHVKILTEHFSTKDAVDAVHVRLELKAAGDELADFEGEPGSPEYLTLIARELWAAAQLELYGDPPPPTIRNEFSTQKEEMFEDDGEDDDLD